MGCYTTCCDSPLGNTPVSPALAVIGLIHTVFRAVDLDAVAPSHMRVFTTSAKGEPKPRQNLPFSAGLKLGRMVLTAHLRGVIRKTPFFQANGQPSVSPRVLSLEERALIGERVG